MVLVSGSPPPPHLPRECPLTLFLKQKAHVRLRLCFFFPTINFDQLSNIKAPFIEVIPHPLVFRIIEVTCQSIQVVIHFFVVFCTKRKSQTTSETPLRTHRIPQITSIFFLNPLPTVLKTKTDTKHYLTVKIITLIKGCRHETSNRQASFQKCRHTRNWDIFQCKRTYLYNRTGQYLLGMCSSWRRIVGPEGEREGGGRGLFHIPVMCLKACITKPREINVSNPWQNKSKWKRRKGMEAQDTFSPKGDNMTDLSKRLRARMIYVRLHFLPIVLEI